MPQVVKGLRSGRFCLVGRIRWAGRRLPTPALNDGYGSVAGKEPITIQRLERINVERENQWFNEIKSAVTSFMMKVAWLSFMLTINTIWF